MTDAPNDLVPQEPATGSGIHDIRHLTEVELARLGMSQIAYVRPIRLNGNAGFAIHAADGTPMAVTDELSAAVAAIVQHDMIPVPVH